MPAFAKFVAGTHFGHARKVCVRALDGIAKLFCNIEAGMFREI